MAREKRIFACIGIEASIDACEEGLAFVHPQYVGVERDPVSGMGGDRNSTRAQSLKGIGRVATTGPDGSGQDKS